jgi:uncharacterized membrane protein YeaQ/YmgE (transglycosylase-associated protein family)
MYFLWCIIVGVLVGWLTGKRLKRYGYGVWMDVLMGTGGALVGGFMLRTTGVSGGAAIFYATLAATLGAAALTAFIRFVNGKRRFA